MRFIIQLKQTKLFAKAQSFDITIYKQTINEFTPFNTKV